MPIDNSEIRNTARSGVSIIIPTTCMASRVDLIERSIASVYSQDEVNVEIIVVANGPGCHMPLLQKLKHDNRITTIYRAEGNVSSARYEGLKEAKNTFVGFLDDDDEYLPGALGYRLDRMLHDRTIDVLVTNGFGYQTRDVPLVDANINRLIEVNMIDAFLERNWFASAAPLFRMDRIEQDLFDIKHKYYEWTYLFFSLVATNRVITYDPKITYRIYQDHSSSASRGENYLFAYPEFLDALLKLPLDKKLKTKIRRKRQSAMNYLSVYHLERHRKLRATKYHLSTLWAGGWRYLPYSRRILAAFLKIT